MWMNIFIIIFIGFDSFSDAIRIAEYENAMKTNQRILSIFHIYAFFSHIILLLSWSLLYSISYCDSICYNYFILCEMCERNVYMYQVDVDNNQWNAFSLWCMHSNEFQANNIHSMSDHFHFEEYYSLSCRFIHSI